MNKINIPRLIFKNKCTTPINLLIHSGFKNIFNNIKINIDNIILKNLKINLEN
jgi:hypothetical protein